MQDQEKLREIDSLGEEDSMAQEEFWETPEVEVRRGWGGAPLLQAVICALALLALVFFKFTDEEKYREISQWYGKEMAQEIELPQWQGTAPAPSPSPTPAPTPSPTSPIQADTAPLQML